MKYEYSCLVTHHSSIVSNFLSRYGVPFSLSSSSFLCSLSQLQYVNMFTQKQNTIFFCCYPHIHIGADVHIVFSLLYWRWYHYCRTLKNVSNETQKYISYAYIRVLIIVIMVVIHPWMKIWKEIILHKLAWGVMAKDEWRIEWTGCENCEREKRSKLSK